MFARVKYLINLLAIYVACVISLQIIMIVIINSFSEASKFV